MSHSHGSVGEIVRESSNIDDSMYHHNLHPNSTNLNLNDNPEENEDHVDYETVTDNEMKDQGFSNKTANSERFSINDSSKASSNKKLILRLSMKKHNHKKSLQKNMSKVSLGDHSNTKSAIDKSKPSNDEKSGVPNINASVHDEQLSNIVTENLKRMSTLVEKLS